MKKLTLSLLLSLAFLTSFSQQKEKEQQPKVNFYSITLNAALDSAIIENKYIFVYFYHPKDKGCDYYENVILADSTVVDYLNKNYINVKVNGDSRYGYGLLNDYEIEYYPTIMIFSNAGQIIGRDEGLVEYPEDLLDIIGLFFDMKEQKDHVEAVNKEIFRLEVLQRIYDTKQRETTIREKREAEQLEKEAIKRQKEAEKQAKELEKRERESKKSR